MRLIVLLLLPLLLLLLAAIATAAALVLTPGELALSWQGWLALGLGVLGTLLLGAGLMALLFYSARRGYDEVRFERQDPSARH